MTVLRTHFDLIQRYTGQLLNTGDCGGLWNAGRDAWVGFVGASTTDGCKRIQDV